MSQRLATANVSVTRFLDSVLESLESFDASGRRVMAAVSGGSDSTALLTALVQLASRAKIDVVAAHVNHQLRGDASDADERFVRQLCDRHKIPLCCRNLPVPRHASERGDGIEATARDLRLRFFVDLGHEWNAPFVATAHTADDQAETVLYRILRGTGLAGLAGMPASRELAANVRLIRPMLQLHRTDVLQFLAAVGQEFREDGSNRDVRFTRNRVRHELIPYLARQFNPHVTESLLRLASHAADAQSILDAESSHWLRRATVKKSKSGSGVVLRRSLLKRLPGFMICEVLRRVWTEHDWPLQEMGQAEWCRLAAMVVDERSAPGLVLPGRIQARRTGDTLTLQPP